MLLSTNKILSGGAERLLIYILSRVQEARIVWRVQEPESCVKFGTYIYPNEYRLLDRHLLNVYCVLDNIGKGTESIEMARPGSCVAGAASH